MSPIAITGVVWLSFGFIAVAIAAWKKLNVVPWVFFGPILGLFAIYLVLLQVAAKSRPVHGQPTVLPTTAVAATGVATVLAESVSAADTTAALVDAMADTTEDGAADASDIATDLRHFNAVLGSVGLPCDLHRVGGARGAGVEMQGRLTRIAGLL
jgi:hypothetical protein